MAATLGPSSCGKAWHRHPVTDSRSRTSRHDLLPWKVPWKVPFEKGGLGGKKNHGAQISDQKKHQGSEGSKKGSLNNLHPQKLTWNLEMMVSNRNLLFQGSIFRFHVCFGGCKRLRHEDFPLKNRLSRLEQLIKALSVCNHLPWNNQISHGKTWNLKG